jgi:hypothetical protein
MSIQKKSLLSTLNTTKKAIVASSTTPAQGTPSVNAPISARIMPRTKARIMPRTRARVMSRTKARITAV